MDNSRRSFIKKSAFGITGLTIGMIPWMHEGVKSTHLCHLANIASRIGKGFDINPANGQALDRDALKLWSREYEPGWEPEL